MGRNRPRSPRGADARWERYRASDGTSYPLRSGDALREARRARPGGPLSQARLAEAAGCNPSLISHLESGRIDAVLAPLADAIEAALGVEPGAVFERPAP